MRHLTQKLAFITILTFTGTVLFGQGFTPSVLDTGNSVIRGITLKVDDAGWLYIKPEARLEPGDLFDAYKGATGLGAYDTMVVEKQWTDQHDWSHIRYQQHYKGLEVEAAEWSEHWKDCFVEISHGKLVEGLDINVSPTLSEASALDLALQHIDASEYAWENEDWEDGLKEDVEDENATYYPEGELLIGHVFGDELIEENYRLAWKFQIRAIDPPSLDEIYIDAHTGDVLRMNPVGEGNGPANIMFGYGTQTIDTKPHLWYHILKADNNGRNIHTKFGTNLTDNFGWRPNITDPNDDWGNDDQRGTTAHWVVSEAWDYFRDVHNRNGFDGDGERVRVWANSNFVGVRFIRDGFRTFIELGSIDGNYAATLDFAGHEFTHGITHRVAGLGNTRESGALNESFSDIFGVLVERNTLDGNFNWLIGDDAIAGGIRSLSDPGTFGDPDIYMGPTWRDADPDNCPVPNQANDNCWVHFNCGVQNRWFHLIATGDTHNDITVQSLGIDNSADITYYSLFTFMQTASQYADARQGAINAARILYGRCSFEEIQTTNAWAACGVGDPFAGPCLHLSGPSLICVDKFRGAVFTATDIDGSTFSWTFPFPWTTHTSGPGNQHLIVDNLGYLPPYFPYTLQVSVTSSNGGTRTINVVLDECFTLDPCMPGPHIDAFRQGNTLTEASRALSSPADDFTSAQRGAGLSALYPNPASDILHLAFHQDAGEAKTITLLNAHGKAIIQKQIQGRTGKLYIDDLPPGVYFIRIESALNMAVHGFVKTN